jgi:hypothetical protein
MAARPAPDRPPAPVRSRRYGDRIGANPNMGKFKVSNIKRRNFLGAAGCAPAGCAPIAWSQTGARGAVSIVLDPSRPVTSAAPVHWAGRELQPALADVVRQA